MPETTRPDPTRPEDTGLEATRPDPTSVHNGPDEGVRASADAQRTGSPSGPPPGRRGVPPVNGTLEPVDAMAVVAALQDQVDDLTAAVEAQQRTIDQLVRNQRAAGFTVRDGDGNSGPEQDGRRESEHRAGWLRR